LAVVQAGGNVVCVSSLCNRSDDKKAVRLLIGQTYQNTLFAQTYQNTLFAVDMDNFPAKECPYCLKNFAIRTDVGHGAKFLGELAKTNPEKAKLLGYRG
jgi:hypothetical protein